MAKYVIIGNSTAAIGCVEGIRSKDKDGEIVLIASENHHTYARPLISYLLQGKTDEERMKYRPDSFYEENHVTAKLGETVTKLDPEKKTVTLKSGEEIPYEKLLVATGSTPFVPPMEGLDTAKADGFLFAFGDIAYRFSTQNGWEKGTVPLQNEDLTLREWYFDGEHYWVSAVNKDGSDCAGDGGYAQTTRYCRVANAELNWSPCAAPNEP